MHAPAENGVDPVDLSVGIELEDMDVRKAAAEVHKACGDSKFEIGDGEASFGVIQDKSRSLRGTDTFARSSLESAFR